MASKSEKDRAKQIQDRCQNLLMQMLKDEDNKYCVDCDAKGPRWASWNIGIFLCIRCAGIHRNLGVHISKVKSVNLDSWTPEQVVSLQQMGNSRARAVYEANLPDSFRRPQNDSSLEAFIRAKYEQKKYIAKEWVPPTLPKVNWDKEIDEEIERQKKKKKSSTLAPLPAAPTVAEKKYTEPKVIPNLPKPKMSVSPKSNRSVSSSQSEASKTSNGSDLLGLNTKTEPKSEQDDIFSSFFSAPQEQTKPKEIEKTDLKIEEDNFFNQPAPTEKEKSKLTKDSILALYGQTPNPALANQFSAQSQGFSQFHGNPQIQSNQQFQVPGAQFQATNFQGNSQFPQLATQQFQAGSFQSNFQQFPSQNGVFQQAPSQNSFQQTNVVGFQQGPQHSSMQQPGGHSNSYQLGQSQFPQVGGPSQGLGAAGSSAALQQQLGALSLGQPAFPAQPPANLATNLTWQ